MDEPTHLNALRPPNPFVNPVPSTRLTFPLQHLLLCYEPSLAQGDSSLHSAHSRTFPTVPEGEPTTPLHHTGMTISGLGDGGSLEGLPSRCGGTLKGRAVPTTADISPLPLPSTPELDEGDAADDAQIIWRSFLHLHCPELLRYNKVSEAVPVALHPSGYERLHLSDFGHACRHSEQSNALWNLLRNHPDDAAYSLSFARGLVRHLGLLRSVSPEEFLLESPELPESLPKWRIGRDIGAKTSNPTDGGASCSPLPCPCGCVRDGVIADRPAFHFHSSYYKIHDLWRGPGGKSEAECLSPSPEKNVRVGSAALLQKSHRVASLQLVTLPVLAVQILATFVLFIQSRYVSSYSLDSTGPGQTPSQPAELHPQEAYQSFFTLQERRLVVAACTLLAWKHLDTEGDAHAFVLAKGFHVPGHAPPSQLSREHNSRRELGLLMASAVEDDEDALDAFSDFRYLCSTVKITTSSHLPANGIYEMEAYIFTSLKGCVGVPPLWWRVATEVVRLYYYDTRLRGWYALNCFCRHTDDGGLRQNYQYAIQRVANRSMALLLLPHLLDTGEGDATKNRTQHSDLPIMANAQSEHPTPCTSGINIRSDLGTELPKTLASFRRHMMLNPLLGVGLAIYSGAVPLDWALRLITLHPCFNLASDEQSATVREEVQGVNRDFTTQLSKVCSEIQSWFDAVDAL